jgi:uncharacterized membrane protein
MSTGSTGNYELSARNAADDRLRSALHALPGWLERHAWPVLGLMVALYACIFSAAAIYKLHSFWMGFDLGVHEQVLWNTMHGRLAEVSPFGGTRSYLGIDIIIIELLLTPFYALYPRTETMLVLQVALASTGAVPLFLLARQRAGLALYGLLAALLYFASLSVQYAILYEFQIRTVGTVLFLWAFLFFERRRFWLFLLFGVLAIWTRSEGGFVLAAMGLYALIHRRGWPWVVAPALVGLGWVALCVRVLIPAFRSGNDFLYSLIYAWLGNTPGEMLQTLLLRPGYVAEHIFTPEKLGYLLDLFGPLLFLPLLRPDILLMIAPSLLINLVSLDRIHWSIRYHYQAFIVPFLLVATIYAITGKREQDKAKPAYLPPFSRRVSAVLALLLVLAAFGSQLVLRSPLISLATRERNIERIATANEMIALVPDDASLNVTSTLAPHVARRRELYFFPGDDVIYPAALAERGRYLLADLEESDVPRLRRLQRSNEWRTLAERGDFVLLERVEP